MELPPNLVRTTTSIVTNAVPNTATVQAVIAAPGATQRLRLWAWQVLCDTTAQAAANWRVRVRNAASGGTLGGWSSANFEASPMLWIPGGTFLSAATAIDCNHSSALASHVLVLVTYHTVEALA